MQDRNYANESATMGMDGEINGNFYLAKIAILASYMYMLMFIVTP